MPFYSCVIEVEIMLTPVKDAIFSKPEATHEFEPQNNIKSDNYLSCWARDPEL